jgi:hypothetical protein
LIDLLIAAGIGALVAHAKNQTFEGKLETLQRDCQNGKLSPQQAALRYQSMVDIEIDKIPGDGIQLPSNIKQALENGLDYKQLAGKVDADTYNQLHAAYWYGDWDTSKRKK